jgi:uncharacterized protein YggT (Ycf19 family)
MDRDSKRTVLTVGKVVTGVVYGVILVYIVILTMAFLLRLFGANPAAGFADWVYTAAGRIMEPFRGIFPTENLSANSVLDFSLLFAVIIYAIFALLIGALVHWLSVRLYRLTAPPPQPPIVVTPYAPYAPTPANVNVGAGMPPTTPGGPVPPVPPPPPAP